MTLTLTVLSAENDDLDTPVDVYAARDDNDGNGIIVYVSLNETDVLDWIARVEESLT